jgi:hypothetical protein
MKLSKIVALSMLLVTPFALARVQLDAHFKINHSLENKNRSIATQLPLDAEESPTVIYEDGDLRIEAQVLAELENEVLVRYTLSVKNTHDVYEIVSAPKFRAAYGETATLVLEQKTDTDEQCDSLRITLKATKI